MRVQTHALVLIDNQPTVVEMDKCSGYTKMLSETTVDVGDGKTKRGTILMKGSEEEAARAKADFESDFSRPERRASKRSAVPLSPSPEIPKKKRGKRVSKKDKPEVFILLVTVTLVFFS